MMVAKKMEALPSLGNSLQLAYNLASVQNVRRKGFSSKL